MQLSLVQIQEIATLQQKLAESYTSIRDITDLLDQLLTYHCSVTVGFTMANETKLEEERKKKEAEERLIDPWEKHMKVINETYRRGMCDPISILNKCFEKNKSHLTFLFSEAEAIALLNQVLTMRRAEKKRLIEELRRAMHNTMAASLYIDKEDPIKM